MKKDRQREVASAVLVEVPLVRAYTVNTPTFALLRGQKPIKGRPRDTDNKENIPSPPLSACKNKGRSDTNAGILAKAAMASGPSYSSRWLI